MKTQLNFFSITLAGALVAYNVLHIVRSELGVGMVQLAPLFYISFIILICLMGGYLLFNRDTKIPGVAKVVLLISIYWGIKTCFAIHPTDYNILSVEYSFVWFLAIVFSYNFFSKIENNDSFTINLFFICYIATCIANLIAYFTLKGLGISIIPLIYNSIIFLPWILVSNKKNKIAGLIILAILSILSAKRGAILILAAELLIFGYYLFRNERISLFYKICISVITTIFIYNTYNKVSLDTDSILAEKMTAEELADGSGRADIYEYGYEEFSNMYTLKEYLFGYDLGSENLIKFGGHNDWLTYILHYGLIGIMLYLLIYVYMLWGIIKLKRQGSDVFQPYLSLFIIMLILSLVSSSYNPVAHPLIGMLFIGYAESKIKLINA